MRVRISIEVPTLYMELTPAQIEALEDEYDWQPFIDSAYDDLESHIMTGFTIEDVREY